MVNAQADVQRILKEGADTRGANTAQCRRSAPATINNRSGCSLMQPTYTGRRSSSAASLTGARYAPLNIDDPSRLWGLITPAISYGNVSYLLVTNPGAD